MASRFNYAIAERVIRSLSGGKELISKDFVYKLASFVRINRHCDEKPELVLPWNKVVRHFNEENIPITSDLIRKLKGNGLIIPDGIVDVGAKENGNPLLIFTISSDSFIEETLVGTFKNISNLKNVSPSLKLLPECKSVVEYSSPNIAKPFHVGHIRSTIIGNFISNLKRYLGNEVTSVNYLGDWGTQYGILTAGLDAFASDKNLDDLTLPEIVNIYVAANARAETDDSFFNEAKKVFNEMENGDERLLSRWNKLRQLSVSEFHKSYERLGVKFDEIEGESMYREKAYSLVDEIKKRNLDIVSEDGALKIQIMSAKHNEVELPLLKKDGSTLYITRDVAAAIDRKTRYDFDEMFYVVENGQTEHFVALKQILQKMERDWFDSLHHVKFGRIRGLSTRKGRIVVLDDLLNEAKRRALDAMEQSPNTKVDQREEEEIADVLGVSAVIVNDLKARRQNDYDFDWTKVLRNKGDSGIELQYNHARLSSIDGTFGELLTTDFDSSVLYQPEALRLVAHIAKFDEVIFDTNSTLQPCVLTQYLFRLCFLIGKANRVLILKGNERRISEARYFLFHVSRLVLNQGMRILGLKPLERM